TRERKDSRSRSSQGRFVRLLHPLVSQDYPRHGKIPVLSKLTARMKNSTNVKKLWTLSVLIYADLGCRSGTNWQLASREESLALAITMHAAPSRTEVVN